MRIGADVQIQVQVPRDATGRWRFCALPGNTQASAVLHTGRNRDLDRRATAGPHAALGAERSLGKGDGQLADGVGATRLARANAAAPRLRGATAPAAAAEQAGEDVADVELAELDAAGVRARPAESPGERVGIEAFRHAVRPDRRMLQAIVFAALLRIAEHRVRFVDLLEAFGLLLVVTGDVGVVLLRQLAVGLLDRGVVRVLCNAERLIEILHRRVSPS